VWRQIESFAGYSFSKAHSASYAVESFQSLYLKAHYPKEFMVAVINNFGGFYPGWVYFNEARRCGAKIQLPCVNKSEYTTTIYGDEIYIGFIHLANLESDFGRSILTERKRNGDFASLEDFAERTAAPREQLTLLIRIGALRFTGKAKTELLWEMHLAQSRGRPLAKSPHRPPSFDSAQDVGLAQSPGRPVPRHPSTPLRMTASPGRPVAPSLRLFPNPTQSFTLPKLEYHQTEDAYDEIELLGFPVSMSYFDLLMTPFRGEIKAMEMMKHLGKTVRMLGELVTIKYVRTVKKEWMHFGAFVDTDGEMFDTVHFPDASKNYPFRGHGMYLVMGVVVEEFGFPSLNVLKMAKMPIRKDPRG